jgi:hypothetical protein
MNKLRMHTYSMKSSKAPKLLKMPRQRGVPADRDEMKVRRGLMITPKAWDGLTKLAKKLGYKSKSDLIEAIGREEAEIVKKQDEAEASQPQ